MSVIPDRDADCIQFFEQRADAWLEHAPDIGLTADSANQVKADTTAARDAYTAALAAREASKVATMALSEAMRALRTDGGNAVKTIRAYAQTTGIEKVYQNAMIPPPAEPRRNTPPARPTDLRASLDASSGALRITWKCAQPEPGTSYAITRRTGGAGAFAFVGVATGRKSFVDPTIPAGATRVEYKVTGQRGTVTGPASAVLSVQFGAQGGGGGAGTLTIASRANAPFKRAA
jgi:hypothetical protein